MTRFGPKYTASGAGSAIFDLRQRPNESAAAFMDRVQIAVDMMNYGCLLYTSPSPRDLSTSRMPSSA